MKIRLTLTIIVLLAFITSCNDATDIVQQGEINDAVVFTNVANMQLFLNETYDRLSLEQDILTSSLLTDEVACASGLNSDDTQRFAVFAGNDRATAIWDAHYNLINYCNRVIRGATLFTPPAADVPEYNSILAQAKALRAFAHFELLTLFSQDISDPNALGVMLLDHVPTILEQPGRAKNADVFALIDADIAYADANLIDQTGATAYKYVSHNFLDAFRARMYLYRKNYTQAQFYADKVINTSGISLASCLLSPAIPNYPATTALIPPVPGGTTPPTTQPSTNFPIQRALYTVDQWTSAAAPAYRKMWTDAAQGEVIFGLDRQTSSNNFSSRYNTNGSYLSGGPLFDMGRTLFDLYTQPLGGGAQDFRRWCFVDRSSTISTFITFNAGGGYTTGTYTNVATTGGSGTGFTANIKVGSGPGSVTEVVIANPGTGYAVGDVLSFTLPGATPSSVSQITITAVPSSVTRSSEQIVIDKYPGKNGSHTANDLKVFRISEMYFIKAECAARANDFVTAADMIRQVRQARNYIIGAVVPAPVYANATAAFADILLERRKELCFEGHRYIDLKRLGADAGVTGTDRFPQDASNSSATSPINILLGDYRFTLPIPQDEINVNPLPQNTGYF